MPKFPYSVSPPRWTPFPTKMIRNYLPLTSEVRRFPGEQVAQGREDGPLLFTQGGEEGLKLGEDPGAFEGTEATADFLLDLGRSYVPFGLVVGERCMGLKGKSQHAVFVALQALEEISALGSFGFAAFATLGWRFLLVRLLEDVSKSLTHLILGRRVLDGRGIGAGTGRLVQVQQKAMHHLGPLSLRRAGIFDHCL